LKKLICKRIIKSIQQREVETLKSISLCNKLKEKKIEMSKILDAKKLKILRNKTKVATIALVLLLTVSATFVSLGVVKAHDPPWSVNTWAFISAAPDPVGLGQTIFINFWLQMPAPGVQYFAGLDVWHFTVTVTKPDHTTQTLGPFTSDATGGTYTTYVADQLGEYTFKVDFPGQTVTMNSSGLGGGIYWAGDWFEPATASTTVTVQQEQVMPYPQEPLPTGYWERPIYAMNDLWSTIGGNWLGLAASTFHTTGMYNYSGNFAPYTTAPKSPHIIWTRPIKPGGQYGGEFGGNQLTHFVSTSQYQPLWAPIIIAGRLYWQERPGSNTYPTGWNCVDMRTGELIWHKNITDNLLFGQILDYVSVNQYGGYAYLWADRPRAPGNTGSTYGIYDSWTGEWVCDIVNATTTAGITVMGLNWMLDTRSCKGSLLGYYVDSFEGTLNMWNSTRCILRGTSGTGNPNSQSWSPRKGAEYPFSGGVQWSAPIPTTMNNQSIPLSIITMTPDVIVLSYMNGPGFSPQWGWSVDVGMSARDGTKLWGPLNRTWNKFTYVETFQVPAGDGVYCIVDRTRFQWTGFSLTTGQKLWGPIEVPHNSWDMYGVARIAGYGNIYAMGLGGTVNCIDLQTGTIEWTYNTGGSGYDTPYGVWTIWTFNRQTLADGKLYFGLGHEYSPPTYRGAREICLDAFTGEELWSVLGFYAEGVPAIADGTMVVDNAYDMQLYAFDKGRTATTVTTKQDVIALGESALIQGTVTDQSPGQTCLGIPAAGTPAIADLYMKPWMEYLYMQQPMPQNATGVPVMVQAMDSAGNMIDLGTVTSDAFGNFKVAFCPDEEDVYTILASFLGSDAYYASYASTGLAVGPAPPEPEPYPEPEPAADYTPMFTAIIAAVAVAIIIGIVNLYALWRRK
jgi:hypothetical protein